MICNYAITVLTYREASMGPENAEVQGENQQQIHEIVQGPPPIDSDRQRDTDLRSVELGTARTMDIKQIGLMFREMHTSMSRLEESMKEMENRLKDSQKEIKDEFKNIRAYDYN